MTALTEERPTREADYKVQNHPVAAAVTCLAGAIAVLDAAGNVKPAVTATGLTCVGRFEQTVDNSGGSAGDLTANVMNGIFRYANSASSDLIARAEIGDVCYLVDDQTVAKTDGSSARSAAGTIIDVDATGVWVKMGL